MIAGLFGTEISRDVARKRDTVRSVSGWWMFEKVAEGEGKTNENGLALVFSGLASYSNCRHRVVTVRS